MRRTDRVKSKFNKCEKKAIQQLLVCREIWCNRKVNNHLILVNDEKSSYMKLEVSLGK